VATKAQEPATRPAPATLPPARIEQSFSVPFSYDVTFTRDALAPENAALVEAFTRREPKRRHRVLPIVDAGLAAAFPEHLGGELTVTLLGGIGRPLEVHEMDAALVERAIAWMRASASS
jgi:hypothetical protein